ncbi:Alpha-L-rhamnosidase [Rubrobacter xylanophilus DSM 9941]|uniref:family 78 glycoside hydrolase catalytic domain n=1 Tax=Rubrobacter xylanophilus TaxID=49319 RepID=UPI001C6446A8|nr:family 78 glycoside hydrolase catalytic domain [Rubrobacter xylanophilus]QYJ14959.1 Alpha-L-rhamnosidase [Rubrobacter xylanophilus DSM 9941]
MKGISARGLVLALALVALVVVLPRAGVSEEGGAVGSVRVTGLKSEYVRNPVGIDTERPRFSWRLESGRRGVAQSAYQLLVSSDKSKLAAGIGDVWDSGKVASSRSVNVAYGGGELESGVRYYWKVRVWDEEGGVSGWSRPAFFEMGLLDPSDWRAQWIGLEQDSQEELNFEGVRWIWYPEEGNPAYDAPEGTRYFRCSFELPSGRRLSSARMLITADDGYVLYVNGERLDASPEAPESWREARIVDLAGALQEGPNTLAVAATNRPGPSINPAGLIARLRVEFESGEPLVVETSGDWKANDTEQPGWQEPGFDDSGWVSAREIATYGDPPWGTGAQPPAPERPAPLLRKEFRVEKPVERARVYVSGLAYYELRLNGNKVGDRVLDPGFTDYDDSVLYATYDVTRRIREGENAIGVELGRGFYGMLTPNVWRWHTPPWHDDPKLLLQLEITYRDGTTHRVVSDGSWRATEGPTRSDSLYAGETYDARQEKPGWDRPSYDGSGWEPAELVELPRGRLVAQNMDPIKVVETVEPVNITEPRPGLYVFDMGRTMAGWARLSVAGPAGTEVSMVYGEKLNPDGTVQAENGLVQGGRFQRDEYILKGERIETWEPKFSYKGFRYVQVEGLPEPPTRKTLQGRLVHTAVESIGEFSSSNQLYNTFHRAMRRTILNNLHSIPTDTPMYEKNGWTGDAQLGAPSMIYNFDMATFFTKWLGDMRDSQIENGQLPVIIPSGGWGYNELAPSPEWTAVYPIVAWEMYQNYGDRRVLETHYGPMSRYVDWEIDRLQDGIASTALGDWLPPGYPGGIPPEDTRLTATAYVYWELVLMSEIAGVLGRDEDARRYAEISDYVRSRFNETFLNEEEGHYETSRDPGYRQTSNAIPLAFGMVPEEYEARVAESLAEDIRARGNHLNTGALGTRVLLPVLTEHGYKELAHAVANQSTYPSWGFWFENGADTMWEYWGLDSRSRDHYFFGTIDQWFYKYLAGIRPAAPGYERVRIQPETDVLRSVRASVETVRGTVSSSWTRAAGLLRLTVRIPANATGEVCVPAEGREQVEVVPDGARFVRVEDGCALFEVGSGSYGFVVRDGR